MEKSDHSKHSFPLSFYEKCTQVDENMQARIKPILNQIYENRVIVKELHTKYGVRYSGMINSYRNRLEDIKSNCEKLITEMQEKENFILDKCNALLEESVNEMTKIYSQNVDSKR